MDCRFFHAGEVVCFTCSCLPSPVSHVPHVCDDNGSVKFLIKEGDEEVWGGELRKRAANCQKKKKERVRWLRRVVSWRMSCVNAGKKE